MYKRQVKGIVDNIVSEGLKTYLEEHPQEARAVIEKGITASRAREAAKRARAVSYTHLALRLYRPLSFLLEIPYASLSKIQIGLPIFLLF